VPACCINENAAEGGAAVQASVQSWRRAPFGLVENAVEWRSLAGAPPCVPSDLVSSPFSGHCPLAFKGRRST
jgi:hypothetical protein